MAILPALLGGAFCLANAADAANAANAANATSAPDEKPAPEPALSADVLAPTLSAPAPADPAVITDAVIKKAVREMIAEDPRPLAPPLQERALSGGVTQAQLSAAFDRARVPDCLHPDALKHQPAQLGPIAVVGLYSLPWVISAALRGKCN